MATLVKSIKIQARVLPLVKEASDLILWRMGLNMSEAIELFLYRLILDSKIPFEVEALTPERLRQISQEVITRDLEAKSMELLSYGMTNPTPSKKKIKKDFLGSDIAKSKKDRNLRKRTR